MSTETPETTQTATLVRNLTGFQGDARLFRLTPPVTVTDWADETTTLHEYVIVSATTAMSSGPETYIFPANADGEVVDWCELHGSFRGGLDHEAALNGAGYTID
jgi:hypothetical protein